MTVLSSRSTFRSATVVVVAIGLAWWHDRPARGQACCASAGLVTPARLRSYETWAVGAQVKGRSVFGSLNPGGTYAGNAPGESDGTLEQDFFGVVRFSDRAQFALLIPFVLTRRTLPGAAETGGGLGDVAVQARYDFSNAGEHKFVPGIAMQGELVTPTGTPPERAGDLLAAGTTGQGSFEGSLGVGIEQAFGDYFGTMSATVGLRSSRQVAGVREQFAPRWTGLLAAGRVLPRGATIGTFVTAIHSGKNRDAMGPVPGSDLWLLTTGLASTLSIWSDWRLQGSISSNLPVNGTGRNQTTGVGASLALVRVWP